MRPDLYKPLAGALRLPVIPRRSDAPERIDFAAQAEPISIDKASECHVTPPHIAALMADQFDAPGDKQTLEPSAGTGSLARAMIEAGQSELELTIVERHIGLARGLASQFKDAGHVNRCFLEYAEEACGKVQFRQIIMNPPFSKVKAHMRAALSLLGSNGHGTPGELVALVPITYEHPDAYTVQELGPDTFATAKVRTKIIKIEQESEQ